MTVWELIAPAKRAMLVSAALTGLGAVFSILPYAAIPTMPAAAQRQSVEAEASPRRPAAFCIARGWD